MTAVLKIRMLLVAALPAAACAGTYDPSEYEAERENEKSETLEDEADAGSTAIQDGGRLDAGAVDADRDRGADAGSVVVDASYFDAAKSADASKSDASGELTCAELTYESYGKQFLSDHCLVCHRTGASMGGLNLDNFEDVDFIADEIKRRVVSRSMPRLSAPLSDEEIAKVAKWIDCGPQ